MRFVWGLGITWGQLLPEGSSSFLLHLQSSLATSMHVRIMLLCLTLKLLSSSLGTCRRNVIACMYVAYFDEAGTFSLGKDLVIVNGKIE